MVVFNDLRVSEDRTYLIVDCAVERIPEYEDIYIKEIYLDYYKNSVTYGVPSEKALKIYDNTVPDTEVKAKRIRVNENILIETQMGISDFNGAMFYVIVVCDGTLPASVSLLPCGSDSMVDVGVILDWEKVYDRGMAFVNTLTAKGVDFCSGYSGYENFIMVWHALMAALSAKDYKQLERIWDMFKRVSIIGGTQSTPSGCGCK